MQKRSIDWLRDQEISKRFLVCREQEISCVQDENFEDWIEAEAIKRFLVMGGDGFESSENGFSFCDWVQLPEVKDDPFPFIQPVYARWSCSWSDVRAVYQGKHGRIYIFVKNARGDQQAA